MRLEFETNASVLPFVENEVSQDVSFEVERMLREGIRAAQDGNRVEARKLLLCVTETDENNENAWLWLASISEYPEELLVFLNNVLRVNPGNERALEWHQASKSLLAKTFVQRGVDATKDERRDFARQCFEQALEHDAENEMAWLWLASVADSNEEKKDCFEKVLSINPDNETAQVSLEIIQSQKTQKLFHEALSASFDGNHSAAQEMLETVLSQNSELEDAWVLKSHIANSFEERAECFLKLRVLNPENEMAKANLASWRMLADKVAGLPKADAVQTVTTEEEREEVCAEFAETAEREEAEAQSFDQEPSAEEFSFESEVRTEALEIENQVSEVSEPEAVESEPNYLNEEKMAGEEFALPDRPTEELSFDSWFQSAPESVPAEQEAEQNQFAESSAEDSQPEAAENLYEEFQFSEVRFESDEQTDAVQEFSEAQRDLAAEMEAEESEMHWAFTELKENEESRDDSQELADESVSSEAQTESLEAVTEMSNEAAMEEPLTKEWKNTSPSVFVNYSASIPENPIEKQTEKLAEKPPVEEFANSEMSAAQESAAVSGAVETEPYASEMLAENNYLHQFAENNEELSAAEEPVKTVETAVEEAVEEAIEMQAEEVVETPTEDTVSMKKTEEVVETAKEEFSQPKVELVLCPFCNTENEKQAYSCGSCRTILTLSDLEMLLNQHNADEEKLQQTVASLESENESYGLNAEQMAGLGIGLINLKNYRQGFFYLQESVRMNPNNVLLKAQVNALAIRLTEIEEQQTAHGSMAKNCKILVVDDSPTVRKLISSKLEKCGHEVICAVDGVDALEKINDLVPDLILLDITMPRMDGYQVCKLIRSNDMTREVPVVMISGKDGFFDKVRGKMAGTSGYITKPFGPETLMKTVEAYLN